MPIYKIVPGSMMSPRSRRVEKVASVSTYPPGQHPRSGIRQDMTLVEVLLTDGSKRHFGTHKAWITSHLVMAMEVNPRDEVLMKWQSLPRGEPIPNQAGTVSRTRVSNALHRIGRAFSDMGAHRVVTRKSYVTGYFDPTLMHDLQMTVYYDKPSSTPWVASWELLEDGTLRSSGRNDRFSDPENALRRLAEVHGRVLALDAKTHRAGARRRKSSPKKKAARKKPVRKPARKTTAGPKARPSAAVDPEEFSMRWDLTELRGALQGMKSLHLSDSPLFRETLAEYDALLAKYRAKYPHKIRYVPTPASQRLHAPRS